MIENYLKKIETFISPRNYNEEFIIDNNNNENRLSQLENKKKIDDYLKNKILEGKVKVYDKIFDNNVKSASNSSNSFINTQNNNQSDKLNNQSSVSYITKSKSPTKTVNNLDNTYNINNYIQQKNNRLKNKSQSPRRILENENSNNNNNISNVNEVSNIDASIFNKKIHELNMKNMSYRYEISQLKQVLDVNEQKLSQKEILIQKLEKQRENDAKYLLKLETMINHESKIKVNNTTSNANLAKQEKSMHLTNYDEEIKSVNLNFNDKNDVKEYILNSIKVIQKLKDFQTNVYEISLNYDSINENIIDGMNLIQTLINSVNQSQRLDNGQFQLMITNFEKITVNIQKTLEVKQLEYNLLIRNKDQENDFLNDELLKTSKKIETTKQDRMQDQKIINDLQTQNVFLHMKLNEYIEGSSNNNNNVRSNHRATQINKKTEPIRKSVEKMVKTFEKSLDLGDKTNVKFLENLNYKLKY